ncbi:MAG: GGDEF domain-containing protein [Ilumatobacteraceae bacterium]
MILDPSADVIPLRTPTPDPARAIVVSEVVRAATQARSYREAAEALTAGAAALLQQPAIGLVPVVDSKPRLDALVMSGADHHHGDLASSAGAAAFDHDALVTLEVGAARNGALVLPKGARRPDASDPLLRILVDVAGLVVGHWSGADALGLDPIQGVVGPDEFVRRLDQILELDRRNDRLTAVVLVRTRGYEDLRHHYGPELIEAMFSDVALALRSEVRTSDVVGRLCDEEFAVAVSNAHDETGIRVATRHVIAAVHRPFACGDAMLDVAGCIGLAVADATWDAHDTIDHARLAADRMRQALGSA